VTAYATATDYAAYLGVDDDYDDTERARIDAGLLRAQDDIADAVRYSTYDPTAETVTAALTRATCSRFDAIEESGDETGALSEYSSVKIATVTLTRAAGDGAGNAKTVAALDRRTARILRGAGLLSQITGQA